jgi:hypothetical protein
MAEKPSHIKQLSLIHVCKIRLNNQTDQEGEPKGLERKGLEGRFLRRRDWRWRVCRDFSLVNCLSLI